MLIIIHTIITPSEKRIYFDIPNNYVGKQLEIIAFAKDEGMINHIFLKKAEPQESGNRHIFSGILLANRSVAREHAQFDSGLE